jgi:predicted Fe-Mo cluster-binding NifX family protein
MKIAIPVDEKKLDPGVCPSFGRAPYFLIFDSETKAADYIENGAADSPGGAGIKAAQIIIDSGATVLLTPRCGENAADVLKQAGIPLFKTTDGTVRENIDAYLAEQLAPLGDIHPGFHGHGG